MNKEVVRTLLGGWFAGSFIGALAALYVFPIPAENKDLIVFMLGQLSGFTGAVVAFNFGTSRGSSEKTALMARRDGPLEQQP